MRLDTTPASRMDARKPWACAQPSFVGTCVRMYVISDPTQPHVALITAATLEGIANALAARPAPNLEVYVSQDGHSRALDAAEQVELDERVRAAPLSSATHDHAPRGPRMPARDAPGSR